MSSVEGSHFEKYSLPTGSEISELATQIARMSEEWNNIDGMFGKTISEEKIRRMKKVIGEIEQVCDRLKNLTISHNQAASEELLEARAHLLERFPEISDKLIMLRVRSGWAIEALDKLLSSNFRANSEVGSQVVFIPSDDHNRIHGYLKLIQFGLAELLVQYTSIYFDTLLATVGDTPQFRPLSVNALNNSDQN